MVKVLKEESREEIGNRVRLVKYFNNSYGIEFSPLSINNTWNKNDFNVAGGTVGFNDSVFPTRKQAELFWKDSKKNSKNNPEWVLNTLEVDNLNNLKYFNPAKEPYFVTAKFDFTGRSPSKFTHKSRESAEREAKRIKRDFPGSRPSVKKVSVSSHKRNGKRVSEHRRSKPRRS